VADSRDAAHLAEADSCRRLERDLHDGPQQRLVRLTRDLGRARKQLAEVPEQLPGQVETAVYFVVSKALTNVAKHSAAATVRVDVTTLADEIRVRVVDGGIGGAHPAKGHGLAGLQQRLTGVEGRLEVVSRRADRPSWPPTS
jgi:signal transduction histidine kinase